MIDIGGKKLSGSDIEELLGTDHPMVREFQFVKKYSGSTELSFRLDIIPRPGVEFLQQRDSAGRRIEPRKRVLKEDDNIGCGNRAVYLRGEGLHAVNQTFFPNQEFNDLGIGSALYESQERLYRALGIEEITLLAVDVGRYVWAKQGFDCENRREFEDIARSFGEFLQKESLPPPTSADHLWDIARYDFEHKRYDGYPVGKFWMLRFGDCWSGFKRMDDEKARDVAESSRAATRKKREPLIRPGS